MGKDISLDQAKQNVGSMLDADVHETVAVAERVVRWYGKQAIGSRVPWTSERGYLMTATTAMRLACAGRAEIRRRGI